MHARILAGIFILLASCAWSQTPALPPNDNFSDAIVLEGESGTVSGTNVGATLEEGEHSVSASVWYRWTPPRSGSATFRMLPGTQFDSEICVYTGSQLNNLGYVRASYTDYDERPIVEFSAIAGEAYSIQVVSDPVPWDEQGVFVLDYAMSPAHSEMSEALLVSGESGEFEDSNRGAAGSILWYRWIAPDQGYFSFRIEGPRSFPAEIRAYTMGDDGDLFEVDYRPPGFAFGRRYHHVNLETQEGQEFLLRVNSRTNERGAFRVSYERHEGATNDELVDAILLTGRSGTVSGTTFGSTSEDFMSDDIDRSVWYRWEAPDSGVYEFSTSGPSYSAQVVRIFTGSNESDLEYIEQTFITDHANNAAAIFFAEAGMEYFVYLNSLGDQGGPYTLWYDSGPSDPVLPLRVFGGETGGSTPYLSENSLYFNISGYLSQWVKYSPHFGHKAPLYK